MDDGGTGETEERTTQRSHDAAPSVDSAVGEIDGNGTFAGHFEWQGRVNMDPIQAQLHRIHQDVQMMSRKRQARARQQPCAQAPPSGGDAAGKRSPITDLTDLKGGDVGLPNDIFNDLKNILVRPAFTLYSFDPSKDLHVVQQEARQSVESCAPKNDNNRGKKSGKQALKKKTASSVEQWLSKTSDVQSGACFEALPQTMWWYAVNISRSAHETSQLLPALAPASQPKLTRVASTQHIVERHPSYVTSLLRATKTCHGVTRNWGMALRRVTRNPGVPSHTSDVDRRSSVHRFVTLADLLFGKRRPRDRDRALRTIVASAMSWECCAPTLPEQRALTALLHERAYPMFDDDGTLHSHSVADILEENWDALNTPARDIAWRDTDDDDVDDENGEDFSRNVTEAIWIAHCIVYASHRAYTPARAFGSASCRWYLSADEINALHSDDVSPVLVAQPMSDCTYVPRSFVGKRDVRQERLSTARSSYHGEYARHTPSMNDRSFFDRIRDALVDNIGDTIETLRNNRMFRAQMSKRRASGTPPNKPDRFNTTQLTITPYDDDNNADDASSINTSRYGNALSYSIAADKVQTSWLCNVRPYLGLESSASLNDVSRIPHFRVIDSALRSSFDPTARSAQISDVKYSETERARVFGEMMHQWSRDIAAMEFWRDNVSALERGFDARVRAKMRPTMTFPAAPTDLNHISWSEELTRIAHDLYVRRGLMQDFDGIMLSHDVECDASVRVRPKSQSAPNNARAMLPCAARRYYHAYSPLKLEELRDVYWSLIDKAYGHFARQTMLNERNKRLSLRRLGNFRLIFWHVRALRASTLAAWIRQWLALEHVRDTTVGSIFRSHVVPCLIDNMLAPKRYDEARRRVTQRGIEWDGTYYSEVFTDDDYDWLPFQDYTAVPDNAVDDICSNIEKAMACIAKRGEEQIPEQLHSRYRESAKLVHIDRFDRDALTSRQQTAALLLLGTGVFDRDAFGAMGTRYYVDVLNHASVRRFAHDGALFAEQPEFGRLRNILADQFSADEKHDVQLYLSDAPAEQGVLTSDATSALVRALSLRTERASLASNTTVQSVIDNVGVTSIMCCPNARALQPARDNDDVFFAQHLLNTIMQRDTFYPDDLKAQSTPRSSPTWIVPNCFLLAERIAQLHAFIGNVASMGESRAQLSQYANTGEFHPDVHVTMLPAYMNKVRRVSDAYCTYASGSSTCDTSKQLWHGHASVRMRRERQRRVSHLETNATRNRAFVHVTWGADKVSDRGANFTRDINLPVIRSDALLPEQTITAYRFEVAHLNSYFYNAIMHDPRFMRPVRVATRMFVDANNTHMLRRYTNVNEEPVRNVRLSDTYTENLLRPAKHVNDVYPQIFNAPREEDALHRTSVHIDGQITWYVEDMSRAIPTASASCKPYALRVPAIDYACTDLVTRTSIRHAISYLYERAALPEHFAMFLNVADGMSYRTRKSGADSFSEERAYDALNTTLEECVNNTREYATVPQEHAYNGTLFHNRAHAVMAVHSHAEFLV